MSTIAELMVKLGLDSSGVGTEVRANRLAERSVQRQTWIEWTMLPREIAIARATPMLTTADLLNKCRDTGVAATRRNLSYWQQVGIIPYPTRAHTWAVYPSWMVSLISLLRSLQIEHQPLEVIASQLRTYVASYADGNVIDALNLIRREKAERIRGIIADLQAQLAELEQA